MIVALLELLAATSSSNSEIIVAGITAAATAFGSWLLFRGKDKQNQAVSIVEERKLLASEWDKFRQAVDESLANCRKENIELNGKIEKYEEDLTSFRTEIARLHRLLDAKGIDIDAGPRDHYEDPSH